MTPWGDPPADPGPFSDLCQTEIERLRAALDAAENERDGLRVHHDPTLPCGQCAALLRASRSSADALAARLREERARVLEEVADALGEGGPRSHDITARLRVRAAAERGIDPHPTARERHVLGPEDGGVCECGEPWPCPEREGRS